MLKPASFACMLAIACCSAAAQINTHLQPTDAKTPQSLSRAGAVAIPIEDLHYTRSIGGATWSPDGKEIVLTTNLSGRTNLWKVSASGSWPIQLSQSDEWQGSPTFSPDGKWIVYQQDKGGNELYDLYAIPARGGVSINLTNTPDVRETAPRFSPDGHWIVFNTKSSKSPMTNVAVMDWQAHEVRSLLKRSRRTAIGIASAGATTENMFLPCAARTVLRIPISTGLKLRRARRKILRRIKARPCTRRLPSLRVTISY